MSNKFGILRKEIERMRDATIKACIRTDADPDYNYWQLMQSAAHRTVNDRIDELEKEYRPSNMKLHNQQWHEDASEDAARCPSCGEKLGTYYTHTCEL